MEKKKVNIETLSNDSLSQLLLSVKDEYKKRGAGTVHTTISEAELKQENIKLVQKSVELSAIKRELEDRNYELEKTKKELNKQNSQMIRKSVELSDALRQLEDKHYELNQSKIELEESLDERKRAEGDLIYERNLLQTIMANLPDFVFIKDCESRFVTTNAAHLRALGVSNLNEVLGKTDSSFFPPELAEGYLETEQSVIREKTTVKNITEKVIEHDGNEKWVLTTKIPIFEQYGRVNGLVGISRDITVIKNAEKKVQESLKEKEVLLKEIHHRVKNNLQIISSLLYLQSRKSHHQESTDLLLECRSRVQSMSLIHEKLYKTENFADINFQDYIHSFTSQLFDTYASSGSHVSLEVDASNISLPIEQAVPVALIINELVTNALKYAFPNNRDGKIIVKLEEIEKNGISSCQLVVKDDGVGIPSDVDYQNTSSLGMQLVNSLTSQLDGNVELKNGNGTCFNISFGSR
jgi:two-component system, sensor histidine kinase PdtaS